MKMNFVTLFNSNYLSRGLTLHSSLMNTGCDFHLYVVAFDDVTFDYLSKEAIPRLTVISLKEFEDAEFLRIKPSRTAAEYCWTCTPSTISYCIQRFSLDHCVYIDADMYFYSDPALLFEEWGNRSVLITKHRYTKEYDQSGWNGIYCVQFVGFKNDERGSKALKWWRDACIEWCYNRIEDGKFGDQKYLDDWSTRFEGVCDLEYLGGGMAPWNVQQYELVRKKGSWIGKEKVSGKEFNLIFFHYHSLKFYQRDIVGFSGEYDLSGKNVNELFGDYVKELIRSGEKAKKVLSNINVHGITSEAPYPPITKSDKLRSAFRSLAGKETKVGELHKNLHYIKDLI